MKNANKKTTTSTILTLAEGQQKPCIKLELKNIVFPKWSDIGLIGMMFRQYLKTKEQPEGNLYDEAKFQTVLRVLRGKVLMNNKPDTYCWKFSKLESAKDVRPIGTNCAEGLIALTDVLNEIEDIEEKKLLADMFSKLKEDLLLVTTPAENRTCIEVTEELYNAGITFCVDEWMDTDENGDASVTNLEIGDFLIVTDSGVYCIRREEFFETHNLSKS